MSDNHKLPNWILKVLPVLTGHISLLDFEKWLYLPTSESYFPKELYLELISFNYTKNLSDFLNCFSDFIIFEKRQSLYIIVEFLKTPEYLDFIDSDIFRLLPASDILLDYIFSKINKISEDVYWDDMKSDLVFRTETRKLLDNYVENVILLLRDYDNRNIFGVIRELNKTYK